MTVREHSQQLEEKLLSKNAMLAINSKGRITPEKPCNLRTDFQRDRDRILHCKSFRRLIRKTQVFLAPEGDHYRTRLTHTLEVSQIARTISRALRLNEDLTEAIALGHDLGHTPFGHAGERALNKLMPNGFRHYEQSIRVVSRIENNGKGLNLTVETKDGILNHTTGSQAYTLEGQVVRIADKIAYLNHDIDDAIRAGVLKKSDVPSNINTVLGNNRSNRINTLVNSVVENSSDFICMDNHINSYFDKLRVFMFAAVYNNPVAKSEELKVDEFIERMFNWFIKNPDSMPDEYISTIQVDGVQQAVCDYIAGMTDNYALNIYNELFVPREWEYKHNIFD